MRRFGSLLGNRRSPARAARECRASSVALWAMDRESPLDFIDEKSRPMPILGVGREVVQGAAHDDVRRAPELPVADRAPPGVSRRFFRRGVSRGFWDSRPPMPMPSAFYPSQGWDS